MTFNPDLCCQCKRYSPTVSVWGKGTCNRRPQMYEADHHFGWACRFCSDCSRGHGPSRDIPFAAITAQ